MGVRAVKAGLALETSEMSKVFKFRPDALAAIKNVSNPRKDFNYYLMRLMRRITREGPKALYEVSPSALIRWGAPADMLPESVLYRPKPLMPLRDHIDRGAETLGSIAKHYYRNARKYPVIFQANATMITNPNRIYEGQILLIPHLPRDELAA